MSIWHWPDSMVKVGYHVTAVDTGDTGYVIDIGPMFRINYDKVKVRLWNLEKRKYYKRCIDQRLLVPFR